MRTSVESSRSTSQIRSNSSYFLQTGLYPDCHSLASTKRTQIKGVEKLNYYANRFIRDAGGKIELAFVDSNVANWAILAHSCRANVEAMVLEPTRSADEQIAAVLES